MLFWGLSAPLVSQSPPGCRVGLVSWSDCDFRKLALLEMVGAVRAHILLNKSELSVLLHCCRAHGFSWGCVQLLGPP